MHCLISLKQYVTCWLCKGSDTHNKDLWQDDAPGEARYHYLNAGFALLTLIVECATDTDLCVLMQSCIFNKLKMHHTKYMLHEISEVPRTDVMILHAGVGTLLPLPGQYCVAKWLSCQLWCMLHDMCMYMEALMIDPH